MSTQAGTRVLVLGGIRSGKSELAERLVEDSAEVRYVATARAGDGDPEWAARIEAHRARRPAGWLTEELTEPADLVTVLSSAKPAEAVLVDDLGGWLAAGMAAAGRSAGVEAGIDSLVQAVRGCAAGQLVLVSPEVGLSVVPATRSGRRFADALGELNRAIAQVCEAVVLVVAGQPSWLKGTAVTAVVEPATARAGEPAATRVVPPAAVAATVTVPPAGEVAPAAAPGTRPAIDTGLDLPLPDEAAATAAADRLARLDLPGAGVGRLATVVRFAAGTQGRPVPRPWPVAQLLLLHGDHGGGAAAGDPPQHSAHRLEQAQRGEGPVALLAGAAGVAVRVLRCDPAGPIESADAASAEQVEAALGHGWQLAESAADAGTDVLILGAAGAGTEAAAVAVIAASTAGEPAALLGRVFAAGGRIDDVAWMRRCAAVRDALHRLRDRDRRPREMLAALGGADLATAVGVLLGASSRRTPVLVDGPLGAAAGLLARDFGAQVRQWMLLPDDGGHPAVQLAARVLDLTPVLDLRLGLGEGAAALAALPLLRTALVLAEQVGEVPAGAPAA